MNVLEIDIAITPWNAGVKKESPDPMHPSQHTILSSFDVFGNSGSIIITESLHAKDKSWLIEPTLNSYSSL